jgi:hypothetical protein
MQAESAYLIELLYFFKANLKHTETDYTVTQLSRTALRYVFRKTRAMPAHYSSFFPLFLPLPDALSLSLFA